MQIHTNLLAGDGHSHHNESSHNDNHSHNHNNHHSHNKMTKSNDTNSKERLIFTKDNLIDWEKSAYLLNLDQPQVKELIKNDKIFFEEAKKIHTLSEETKLNYYNYIESPSSNFNLEDCE